jgi:PPOX class probable F420-dependent enzyme
MSELEVAEFLDSRSRGVLGTIGANGSPHLVTIGYVMEGRNVVLNSYRRSQKVVNIARRPEVSFLVETMEAPYSSVRGVLIFGRAKLYDDPAWVKHLEEKMIARAATVGAKTPPIDLDKVAPKRTVILIEPGRVASWDHSRLEGAF